MCNNALHGVAPRFSAGGETTAVISKCLKKCVPSAVGLALGLVLVPIMGATGPGAQAVPALQLGPGTTNSWTYVGGGDDTWYTGGGNTIDLNAYALSSAWDADGVPTFDPTTGVHTGGGYGYLVIGSVPESTTDNFGVTVSNTSGTDSTVTMVASGYGAPPLEDPNSLASHGIWDSYFEIYQFSFNDAETTVSDTQPGETGTAQGFAETLTINFTGGDPALTGLHFDLFTISDDGGGPPWAEDKKLVKTNAPFSHDAQWSNPGGPSGFIPIIPIPAAFPLMAGGLGLLGLLGWRRRRQVA